MPIPSHWSIPGIVSSPSFDNPGIWDDGEWISWHEINSYLDPSPVGGLLEDMIVTAKAHLALAHRHLPVSFYEEIAFQYAAARSRSLRDTPGEKDWHGWAKGSAPEIRVLHPRPPHRSRVSIAASEEFDSLLVVKIDPDFKIDACRIDRKHLPKANQGHHVLTWKQARAAAALSQTSSQPPGDYDAVERPIAGEWISWEYIRERQVKSWGTRQLIDAMIDLDRKFSESQYEFGKHISGFYGPMGELYATLRFGIFLHEDPHHPGSDGTLGDLRVEVKTIGPEDGNWNGLVTVKERKDFDALVIVKVDHDYRIDAKMIPRKRLPAAVDGIHTVPWKDFTCDYRELVPQP
ncbi:hypothetical protein [Haloferula sp. BvORR071]|uniref:hypothetical protein n=1 Tax=Haloferula sp. BvORR071 TaxID=1396141 RepID=UPI0005576DE3|nr:hypothetical protein [Haloferula sp. BvORR071]